MRVDEQSEGRLVVRQGWPSIAVLVVGVALLGWFAWAALEEPMTSGLVIAGVVGLLTVRGLDSAVRQACGVPLVVADESGVSVLRPFGRRLVPWEEIGHIGTLGVVDVVVVALWGVGQTPGNMQRPRATVGPWFRYRDAEELAARLDRLRTAAGHGNPAADD